MSSTNPRPTTLSRRSVLAYSLLGAAGMGTGVVLAGCAREQATDPEPATSDDAAGMSANVYVSGQPTLFSPLISHTMTGDLCLSLLSDTLLGTGADLQFQPRLAESYEVSDDGTLITFNLRKGLSWSDGTPFTAEDVAYTFTLLADPSTTSFVAGNFVSVKGVADFIDGRADAIVGFAAADDSTFTIELDEPNPAFPAMCQIQRHYIVPKHILADTPPAEVGKHSYFTEPSVSIGPFTFVEHRVNQYLELARNPNYWQPAELDRVFVRFGDRDVALTQLQNGSLDLMSISTSDLRAVEAMQGVTIESVPGGGPRVLYVNSANERLSDKRVRQAMLYSIDRQTIVDTILSGQGTLVNSLFTTPAAVPDDLNAYPYDPDKARELLSEVGWDSSVPIRLWTIVGDVEEAMQTGLAVQQYFNEVGLTCEYAAMEEAVLNDEIAKKNYDLFLTTYGNNALDPAALTARLSCDTFFPEGPNSLYYCNPELTELMREANTIPDAGERANAYKDIVRIDNDEVPMLWLHVPSAIYGRSDRLEGFVPNGNMTEAAFWNASQWRV